MRKNRGWRCARCLRRRGRRGGGGGGGGGWWGAVGGPGALPWRGWGRRGGAGGQGGAALDGIELVDAPPGNFSVAEVQRDAARVDCVLAGHHPPLLDARAILHAVRDGGRLDAPPVIIFTGKGDEHLAVELMKGGASDYLIRGSVSGEELARCVRSAVRIHRAEVAAAAAQANLLAASRARDEAVALLDTLVGGAPVGIAFF